LATPNSPASLWIPYEYGRVKPDVVFSTQAGCWKHPNAAAVAQAEYLELGMNTHNEPEITKWLDLEFRTRFGSNPLPGAWSYGTTTPLP
jgi:hypothetical protein